MGAALKFRQAKLPRQQGELARLKVVQGADFGYVFVVTQQRVTLGRGEDNDIVISDLKASRKHAELQAVQDSGSVKWLLKDLGSANGVLLNGQAVRSGTVRTGDTLGVGETTLEFVTGESPTMMLVAPVQEATQIREQQAALADQVQRVRALASPGLAKPSPARMSSARGAPAKNSGGSKLLLIVVAAVGGYLLLMPDPSAPKPSPPKKAPVADAADLAAFLPPSADTGSTVGKTSEMFFRTGFREYRERNYLRAIVEFDNALSINPTHRLARLYKENSQKAIKDDVKRSLAEGKLAFEVGRHKAAKNHFEAVLRILYRDPTNEDYVQAKEQLEKVELAIKAEVK